MPPCSRLAKLLWLLLAPGFAGAAELAAPSPELSFERDVRPILKKNCFQCHGEGEKLKGGLDLRLRRFMVMPDGDGHFPVVAGKPSESELILLLREGEMPKKAKPLAPAQIAILERWVAQGAKTLRPEPEQVPKVWITEVEREFWAFQPLQTSGAPSPKNSSRVRTPIDAFLLTKLEEKGLTFAPDADPQTLLRRLSIDLTGLPPTPDEIDLFLKDTAPNSYERMVDRLLDSPHYGERWGRHWLDVAGYADSDGYVDLDTPRPWAYKYRDYVIRAFNADKPFDQFIQEQLAGDEMVKQPFKDLTPDEIEKLTATGFLRTVPDGTTTVPLEDRIVARNAVVSETIKVVSSALLGMTVGCAQCHDHRLDPIPQVDYYRMRAIFEPALSPERWKSVLGRNVSTLSEADRALTLQIEKEAAALGAERGRIQTKLLHDAVTKELEKVPEELRAAVREAHSIPFNRRNLQQSELMTAYPQFKELSVASLIKDTEIGKELQKLTDKATDVRSHKPVEEFVSALTEPIVPASPVKPLTSAVPDTFLFHRGEPTQPREKVTPGELAVLAGFRQTEIPEKDPALATTGRRLAFARNLTDGAHPLATRVLVNRVWHHHFGRGLVASLSDFGSIGDRPSHPELLDWLARDFVAEGWSMKKLHRLIVCSTAYRQSAVREPAKDQADPENRLLGRMNVRRLEAEVIRDGMLAISGKLNPKMFGPPVPVLVTDDGQIVEGVDTNDGAGRSTGKFVPLNGEEFRRSVYVQERRSRPLGMLETFDLPRMEPNCELRNASTVAPQSLAMMNGEFTLTQAKFLADRVAREAGPDLEAQVKRAWLLTLAAEPAPEKVQRGVEFLKAQMAHFVAHPTTPEPPDKRKEPAPDQPAAQALTNFCQALLTANGFLYVD